MSDDVLDRLAAYGAHLRAGQAPIDLQEVMSEAADDGPVVLEEVRSARPPRSTVAMLLVAACVASVVLGGVWLFGGERDGDDIVPIDSSPAVSVPEVPTMTGEPTQPSTDATGTSTSSTTLTSEPPPATTLPAPPVQLAPDLLVPEPGATQQSIVGDITWTRVDGPISTVEGADSVQSKIEFALDGLLYGSIDFRDGRVVGTSWWTSTDGVDWIERDDVPGAPPWVALAAVDGALWADTWWVWPRPGSDLSPSRWDGSAFVPVELPAADPVPGEGLVVRQARSSVVAGLDERWLVRRDEWFGVPWADLFGIEPPSEAGQTTKSWSGTFEVREAQCSDSFEAGACGFDGRTWRIRPELIDADPVRFDFYDADTGALITSVVPPDDLVVEFGAELVLDLLGQFNEVGGRTGTFVVDSDGTARRVSLPFEPAPEHDDVAELDGRLYAVGPRGNDGEAQLWVTTDLQSWAVVPLPVGIDVDRVTRIVGDGETLVLRSDGSTAYWTTTDGESWRAQSSAIEDPSGTMIAPTDFGWFETGTGWPSLREDPPETPAFAVSPDGVTWQLVPVPLPATLEERGATWSDVTDETDDAYDPALEWDWHASAYGDLISIVLRSGTNQEERWIGRVAPP